MTTAHLAGWLRRERFDKIAPKTLPAGKLGEAIADTSNYWDALIHCRDEGRLAIDTHGDCILTLLLTKHVSGKYAGKPGALIEQLYGGGFAEMIGPEGDNESGAETARPSADSTSACSRFRIPA